jgi:hypothetical protein
MPGKYLVVKTGVEVEGSRATGSNEVKSGMLLNIL